MYTMTSTKDPSQTAELQYTLTGQISTCNGPFLTQLIDDVSYTLGDPPKVVEFDQISFN